MSVDLLSFAPVFTHSHMRVIGFLHTPLVVKPRLLVSPDVLPCCKFYFVHVTSLYPCFDLVTWINVCWKKIKYSNVHVLIKAIFSTLRCDHVHEPGFCPVLSFSTMFSFVSSNVSCDHDWRWTCNTWSPVTPDLRTSDLRWTWLGWYFLLKWVSTLSPCGQCYIFILNKKQNKNVNFLVGCADIANCICCLCFRLSMFCMVTSSLLMFPFVETPGCLRLASL